MPRPLAIATSPSWTSSLTPATTPDSSARNGIRQLESRRTHQRPGRPELRGPQGLCRQLRQVPGGTSRGGPFVFWFGSSDPHDGYQKGSGRASGKTLPQAEVPQFLPDTPDIRDDLHDYSFEVERFNRDCGKMLELLEKTGDYDNTIVIVTSDNGMPFPYANANWSEFGIHMPHAISWKAHAPGGRTSSRLVSHIDLTATIHEATGIHAPENLPLAGASYLAHLKGSDSTPAPTANIVAVPDCLQNLAADPAHETIRTGLAKQLDNYLRATGDPRGTGTGDIFETYPRYSSIRWFPKPDWAKESPDSVPPTPWLASQSSGVWPVFAPGWRGWMFPATPGNRSAAV